MALALAACGTVPLPLAAGAVFAGNVTALTFDSSGHLWAALSGAKGLVEFQLPSGKVLRRVAGPTFGFDDPESILALGSSVWVASVGFTGSHGNASAARLSEVSIASGRLERTVDLKAMGIQGLGAMASQGSTLWIRCANGDALVAVDSRTGSVLHTVVNGPLSGFTEPGGLAVSDGRVFSVRGAGVDVRLASTGRLLRRLVPSTRLRTPGTGTKVPASLGPQFLVTTPTELWATTSFTPRSAHAGIVAISRRSGHVDGQLTSSPFALVFAVTHVADHLYALVQSTAPNGARARHLLLGAVLAAGPIRVLVNVDTLFGTPYQPTALAADGRYVAFSNGATGIAVIDARSGSLIRRVR